MSKGCARCTEAMESLFQLHHENAITNVNYGLFVVGITNRTKQRVEKQVNVRNGTTFGTVGHIEPVTKN
jgi:hypothetical protein